MKNDAHSGSSHALLISPPTFDVPNYKWRVDAMYPRFGLSLCQKVSFRLFIIFETGGLEAKSRTWLMLDRYW